MLLELSKLQNSPVGSFDEGGLVGVVRQVIVDKDEAKVIGFLVKLKGIMAPTRAVSFQDVIDIDQAGIVVRSAESLVEQDEIVRISEILKTNFNLIGLRALSKEKKYLGRVYDALIESTSGDVMRIYVKHLFNDYVFESSQIEEITNKEIKLKTEKRQRAKRQVEAIAEVETA
jgi:uncharacterized protein YrrD